MPSGNQRMNFFDYDLPADRIAQTPAEPRDASRLLVALDGEVRHRRVTDLPDLLEPGDLLVVNDTRVLPARLALRKTTGGEAEVLLLEPMEGNGRGKDRGDGRGDGDTPGGPADHDRRWRALVRPGRRLAPGTELVADDGRPLVRVGERLDGGCRAVELLEAPWEHGSIPLPPYIQRPLADPERYQTVYAAHPGSVAAPTAGLHLTDRVLARCRERGIGVARLELAVGLDTFRPVTVDDPDDHVIHSERFRVPAETMEACARSRRVVAVGTTCVRALETAASTGALEGRTSLFIKDAFSFSVVDVLLTNFHLPRSSLLLLVDAFCGPRWRELYDTALNEGYRFLSFGDAMLVARRERGERRDP